MTVIFASLAIGYLLGSLPFGLLFARLKGVDIREHGSKNIGATNVWRVCGWRYGLPVFVLDVVKGAAAVLLVRWLAVRFGGDAEWAGLAAAVACILGHSFPIWLRFKGGKGVATSLGAVIALMWLVSLIIFGIWGAVFALSRYVSLASIVAAIAFPITAWLRGESLPYLGFAIFAAALVVIRHKGNIQRLLAGTEARAGARKEATL